MMCTQTCTVMTIHMHVCCYHYANALLLYTCSCIYAPMSSPLLCNDTMHNFPTLPPLFRLPSSPGVFENATDFAHIHYLHDDTFGNSEQPEIRDMHVHTDAWGVTANFKLHNKPVNALWEWSSVPEVEVC